MDKDIKVCNKKQETTPKNLINSSNLNYEKNYILNLLGIGYGLGFDGAKCIQTDSIAIHQNNGVWFVKKFNDTKYPNLPPYANFEGIIFALTSHLQGKEKLNAQRAIIDRCTGFYLPTANNLPEKQPKPRQSPKNGLNVEFCDLTDETLRHFKTKGGISKDTLERYGTKSVKKLFGKTQFYLSFGWNVGDNIKVKRPLHPSKKYAQSKGFAPYIFGWEQLPEKGNALIICAGEDDCLCINEHLNRFGVFAVCLSSENDLTTLTDRIVNDLKDRFGSVYVFYDSDNTGYKYSKELSLKFGLIWVNTAMYMPYFDSREKKDICDCYGFGGTTCVENVVFSALAHSDRIEAVKTDKFSIDIPFVYKLEFERYLGEKNAVNFIQIALKNNKHLAVQSPAGTGKSTVLNQIATVKKVIEKSFVSRHLGLEKTIIAVPTTTIAQQLQKSFENDGYLCGLVYGAIKEKDIPANTNYQLVVVVYDSLWKLNEFIPNSLLIIDEFHQIANDQNYRKDAMGKTWGAMQSAPRVLLLSATPNYMLCSQIAEFFDFPLLICKPQFTNKIRVQILNHDNQKKYLYDFINNNAPKKGGCIFLKYDHNISLKTYLAEDQKNGLKSVHFTSKDESKKHKNEHFNSIVQTEKPAFQLDRIHSTTLMEAGVSFSFPIDLVAMFDVKSWSRIIQLATRPRLCESVKGSGNFDINNVVDVWLFNKIDSEKQAPNNPLNLGERWANIYKTACQNADYLNGNKGGTVDIFIETDAKHLCTIINGVWVANVPAILHQLHDQETRETDINTLIERIKRFDSRFEFLPIIEIENDENADLKAQFEDIKQQNKQNVGKFNQLLLNDPRPTLNAILCLSLDKELKDKAVSVLGLTKLNSKESREYISNNVDAFAINHKSSIISELMHLVGEQKYLLKDAVTKICTEGKNDVATQRKQHDRNKRLSLYKKDKKELKEESLLQVERTDIPILNRLQKLIWNTAQRGKNEADKRLILTACELAAIANKATGKNGYNAKSVIDYLEINCKFERIRIQENGKRMYKYHIIGIKKIDAKS